MLRVLNGGIVNEECNICINNMAIVVDRDTGSILKYGDFDTGSIKEWYEKAVKRYEETGLVDMAKNLAFITFDRYKLPIEDICTIVNYGMNCHSEKFLELFDLEQEALRERVHRLRVLGY